MNGRSEEANKAIRTWWISEVRVTYELAEEEVARKRERQYPNLLLSFVVEKPTANQWRLDRTVLMAPPVLVPGITRTEPLNGHLYL